jgi:hypothetical protein
MMIAVTMLSLTAAWLFASSAFLQQRAAQRVRDGASLRDPRVALGLARQLLRSRTWVAGWVTNVAGCTTQAAALRVGSVSTVQPLLSTQLVFALLLSSADQRRWPRPRDWLAVLAVCAGLVLLLTGVGTSLGGDPRRGTAALVAGCIVAVIAVLLLASRVVGGRSGSLLLAVAAGLCHAMNAVFMKLIVANVGVAAALADWPPYAFVASTAFGFLLGQLAFASGPLPSAIAAMSVTNPVAGFVAGLVAFDAPAPAGLRALTTIGVAAVLVIAGIVGLANAGGRHGRAPGDSADDAPEPDVGGGAVLRLR